MLRPKKVNIEREKPILWRNEYVKQWPTGQVLIKLLKCPNYLRRYIKLKGDELPVRVKLLDTLFHILY